MNLDNIRHYMKPFNFQQIYVLHMHTETNHGKVSWRVMLFFLPPPQQ